MKNCPKCATVLLNAPAIGLYCQNPMCDVVDNILNWDEPRKPLWSKRYHTTTVQEIDDGLYIELPPEMLAELGWSDNETIIWTENSDGSYTLVKKKDAENT